VMHDITDQERRCDGMNRKDERIPNSETHAEALRSLLKH
jgi:hypothetical protein